LLLLLLLLLFFPNGAVDEPRGDPPRNAWWWCLWTNLGEFWEVDEEGRLLVAPNNVDVAATTIANLSVICLSVCLSASASRARGTCNNCDDDDDARKKKIKKTRSSRSSLGRLLPAGKKQKKEAPNALIHT
jgi:hypothetical protein